MSGWLSRAKSLFEQKPPPPEPFEVECDCGGKVSGQRTANYQRPVCPVCERPVFVLPINVYPRPTPKPNPKDKRLKSQNEPKSGRQAPNTVVDESAGAVASVPAKDEANSKTAAGRKVQSSKTQPSQKPTPNVFTPTTPVPQVLLAPRAPLFTPLRLVGLAIFVVSIVTGVGLWYRIRIETARSTVAKANDIGMKALREGDYVTAALELGRARRAVDVLGRTDQTSEDIRRFSREANALSNLAASSLTEIIQDALVSGIKNQPEPLRISGLDQDAWVIFDATVFPSDEKVGRYFVDAPLMFREGMLRIEIDSSLFKVDEQHHPGLADQSRFIFAAQLDQISSLKGDPPTAVVSLKGSTAFLWTSYDTFSAIGYHPIDDEDDRQVKQLLASQRGREKR